MAFYENGSVRIYYEEAGSGFPLLVIPGGGLNANIAYISERTPFNPMNTLNDEYHCITMDLRNADGGKSSGPVEVDWPWDSHIDDQLGLMDHLGIDKFMVIGFCIGGPFIWRMLERAPERVVAAVPATPSGFRPESPDRFYHSNMEKWAPALCKKRPDVTMEICDAFLKKMYGNPDFVFSVTRDSVRACTTPVLVMPDDTDAHPYATAEETALLAPNAQMTFFPWKEPKERVAMAIRHLRAFLKANTPA
ncbi:MAG: alpha/beta hydrolase [Proteobacteria bacterium]|nr:alpha/beta hydrolase [Pseudomonadota bacterium]